MLLYLFPFYVLMLSISLIMFFSKCSTLDKFLLLPSPVPMASLQRPFHLLQICLNPALTPPLPLVPNYRFSNISYYVFFSQVLLHYFSYIN